MAFNVYLTFLHKYDASNLRSLEWKYAVLCYGLPFIPPFVYFFVNSSSKGPVYGSATVSVLLLSPGIASNTASSELLIFQSVVVLGISQMGHSPHCSLLWPGVACHPSYLRHLCPSGI